MISTNPERMRASLAKCPKTVGQLVAQLGLAQATILFHLRANPNLFRVVETVPHKAGWGSVNLWGLCDLCDAPPALVCRHCSKPKVNRPRGLCWSCYYAPGVKELYPPKGKYAYRGVGGGNSNSPLPPTPTKAAPGSEEKIRVLMARAEARQALFHPDDATNAISPATARPSIIPARGRCGWVRRKDCAA